MDRLQRSCLLVGLFAGILLNPLSSQAQFNASYQTNVISGVTSNWVNADYTVGNIPGFGPFADVLEIQNGGVFTIAKNSSPYGFTIGWSSNNMVLVTDPGSTLVLAGDITTTIGNGGVGNSLVISNGGTVIKPNNFLGQVTIDGTGDSLEITDPGSVFSNAAGLFVGYYNSASSLVIRNGGSFVNVQFPFTSIAFMPGSSSNSVIVTDSGSVWATGNVEIGAGGNNSSLVVSNGGAVFGHNVVAGFQDTANGNSLQVVGHGSVYSNSGNVIIGDSGSSSSLVITNGGQVFDSDVDGTIEPSGVVGWQLGSNSNFVQVVGGGLWQNGTLIIGDQGSSNSLTIDGGTVLATSLTIGAASPTCDNLVQLNNGILAVTNNGSGVLDVRDGQLVLNGGTLQADTLVITNPCASFVHTGGTLIVGSVILDPNTFKITSVIRQGNDLAVTWLMGPGQTNTLQATSGGPDGSYISNNFTDIFTVTNNTTAGTTTNYLDIGAATNSPSRFYRARLVP